MDILKQKEHNYLIPFIIVVTAAVALWLLFFAHNSVLAWVKTAIEVRGQEKEMARLQSEIEDMDSRIDNLTSNRDSIETYARETYHFAAPGDDVYIAE
ncbi:MAG: septum formation initiator family protein [Bacteroidales bacterium]|jgi:cell division protein FtsB|nr:septum formation initiator family protein [Bacteroidales bacterium]MBQ9654303.1 septum formation initiator family protein [Bacteroidales bacterium]